MKKILLVISTIFCSNANAQCTNYPAALADGDCSTYNTLVNNANISSGTIWGFCGNATASSFSGVNINGGTLRICGNANLNPASWNWNSGIIVVSCSSTLTISSSLILNVNCGIVNYGTVVVNGDLDLQNTGTYFYNQMSTSTLKVTGNLNFPNSASGTFANNAFLMNNGYIKVSGSFNATAGGVTCFLSGGQMECNTLNYMTHNDNCNGVSGDAFTFGSGSGTAILRYITSANLYNVFTASSNWNVYKATGSTQTLDPVCNSHPAPGWGSATITNNAPALTVPTQNVSDCNIVTCLTTVLPIQLTNFTAQPMTAGILINWSSATETDNNYFTVERSKDGENFTELAKVYSKAIKGNSNQQLNYQLIDTEPFNGVSYYRLKQTDYNNKVQTFQIINVIFMSNNSVNIYPNPNIGKFTIEPNNSARQTVQVYDVNGKIVLSQIINGKVFIDASNLDEGVYNLSIISNEGVANKKLVIVR